jgi:SAM-dependent methyltransferase
VKLLAGLRRSLRGPDVRGTIERRLAQLEDRVFDLRNRTDTSSPVKLNALAVSSPTKRLGRSYAPTRARALRCFLNTCEFPPDSVFVDLGCGKGQTLLVASRFAFRRVVGVEFAHELCGIAAANVQAYRKRHRDAAPIDVIEGDAAEYEVKPDENVFYMFDPFKPAVVRRVVLNILSSVAQHSRPVWIVYCHPTYGGVIESCAGGSGSPGMFVHVRTFTYAWKEFAVYKLRPVQGGQGQAVIKPSAGLDGMRSRWLDG